MFHKAPFFLIICCVFQRKNESSLYEGSKKELQIWQASKQISITAKSKALFQCAWLTDDSGTLGGTLRELIPR
jgi:hypothetical protein